MREPPIRLSLVGYWLCVLASIVLSWMPTPLSGDLAAAYDVVAADEGWLATQSTSVALLIVLGVVVLLVAHVAGSIGLFLHRRWGRTLLAASTLLIFLAAPLFGVDVGWGLESLFGDTATLLLGAILAMAYFSSIAERLDAVPAH